MNPFTTHDDGATACNTTSTEASDDDDYDDVIVMVKGDRRHVLYLYEACI